MVVLLQALSDADRGLDADRRGGLTVVELARALSRDKSVISRQLKPLVELGIVERGDDGLHRVGWLFFTIAARAGDQRLLTLAPPVMQRLSQVTQESVYLSVRRGTEVLTVLAESPNRAVQAVGWIGRTAPLSSTSSGRVLLMDHTDDALRALLAEDFERGSGSAAPRNVGELIARIEQVRRDGCAVVVDEFGDDLAAAAAPVRDGNGAIVAALNVRAPSYRLGNDLFDVARLVRVSAAELGKSVSRPLSPARTP